MKIALLTLLCSMPALASEAGVSLSTSTEARAATLLGDDQLAASLMPSRTEPLRVLDAVRLGLAEIPRLDQGGGLSSDARQILALILGIIPGFGIGHLIAHDRNGFVLFLIIDIVLYVVWGVIGGVVWSPFRFVGSAIWLVVHIIQGLDAYAHAGGERFLQLPRDEGLRIATGGDRYEPAVASRVFSLAF